MKNSVIPLAALAASNTALDVMNHDDPLGGDGKVRTPGTAHARNATKTSSASGGIAGFNPD